MSKKMMLLALAAVSAALFALPAVASAQTWHLSGTPEFTIDAEGPTVLKTSTGSTVECTGGAVGSGKFNTTTAGTVNLAFETCKNDSGFNCTNTAATNTIKLGALPFEAIMVANHAPGILIKGSGAATTELHFGTFTCAGFIKVEVFGNGIIGTITSPTCGVASGSANLSFASTAHGTQADMLYTGTNYDLKAEIANSGHHQTASMDGKGKITFIGGNQTMTCTA